MLTPQRFDLQVLMLPNVYKRYNIEIDLVYYIGIRTYHVHVLLLSTYVVTGCL